MVKPFSAHEPHKTGGGLDVATGPSAVSVKATGTSLLSHYSRPRSPTLPLPKTKCLLLFPSTCDFREVACHLSILS